MNEIIACGEKSIRRKYFLTKLINHKNYSTGQLIYTKKRNIDRNIFFPIVITFRVCNCKRDVLLINGMCNFRH